MNVLIDLQHPAHLHFFRNVAEKLVASGHRVHFTGRDKDILVELGRLYGIEIEVFGVARKGLPNLAREWIHRQAVLTGVIRRFRPDVMLAIAGTFVSSLGRAFGIPTYVFYDTEHAVASNALAYPFATCTYVPQCYLGEIPFRHERYAGYHELAYLHPRYFSPDPTVLAEAGIGEDEPFSLVRFVGWGAAHDIAKRKLTLAEKRSAVERLQAVGRVVISGEGGLPAELQPFQLRLPVHRIHHLMHYARLIFGESGTMPSEASVMGVPSVYVNPLRLGYLEEQERDYGLVSCFRPERFDAAVERGVEILTQYDRQRWRRLGAELVADKVDVTEMLFRIAVERPYWRGNRRSAVFWAPDPASAADPVFIVSADETRMPHLAALLERRAGFAICRERQSLVALLEGARRAGTISRDRVVDPAALVEAFRRSPTAELAALLEAVPPRRDEALGSALHRALAGFAVERHKARWGVVVENVSDWRALERHFPTARFLVVVRDGRDVVRAPGAEEDLVLGARIWQRQARAALNLTKVLGARALCVKYEDIMAEPEAALAQACAFLGLDVAPSGEDRTTEVVGSAAEELRSLSAQDAALLAVLLGTELRALGYTVADDRGPAGRAATRAAGAARYYRALALRAARSFR